MESTPCATTGVELPWNLPLDELLRRLHAKPGGLADRDANRRLAEYGPNDALMHRRRQLWWQIIERLANPLIIILLCLDRRSHEIRHHCRHHSLERRARCRAAAPRREHH